MARLMGNVSRFHDVHFRPEPPSVRGFTVLWRLIKRYWGRGRAARRFFWRCVWGAVRQSPRLLAQTVVYMGMYLHFCKVHGDAQAWDPWAAAKGGPIALPVTNGAEPVGSCCSETRAG